MKRRTLVAGLVLIVAALAVMRSCKSSGRQDSSCAVTSGPFTVVSTYEGEVESRHVEPIMSHLNGPAAIVDLVPEGTAVKKGDVLVNFEDEQIKEEMIKKEREFAVAECELVNVEKTKQPLEIRDLEYDVLENKTTYAMEKRYLDETDGLLKDGLVSKEEVENQQLKVEKLEQKLKTAELRLELTREQLHPAMLKRAKLELAAAEQALNLARQQYSNCVIRAPIDGMVDYKPLWIDQENRVVRVADLVHQNQPFMMIPDLSNLLVVCSVPETEFSLVKPGGEAAVVPLAYPDIKVPANIETVTSIAQASPDRPYWQKSFRMVVAVTTSDQRLRPGMSVHVHVLSYRRDAAVLVPRAAIFWKSDMPFCKVITMTGGIRNKNITLGRGNETQFEVLEGLKPGDKVALE
jgi:multidrug resistance efflux pump